MKKPPTFRTCLMLDVTSFNWSWMLWDVRMSSTRVFLQLTSLYLTVAELRQAVWAIQPAGFCLRCWLVLWRNPQLHYHTTGTCAGGLPFPPTRQRCTSCGCHQEQQRHKLRPSVGLLWLGLRHQNLWSAYCSNLRLSIFDCCFQLALLVSRLSEFGAIRWLMYHTGLVPALHHLFGQSFCCFALHHLMDLWGVGCIPLWFSCQFLPSLERWLPLLFCCCWVGTQGLLPMDSWCLDLSMENGALEMDCTQDLPTLPLSSPSRTALASKVSSLSVKVN